MSDGFFMDGADAPVDILDELNRETYEKIVDELPAPAVQMVRLHLTKPWVPDFKSIVIAPLRQGLEDFLDAAVFDWEGYQWHFPSAEWWMAHAKTSHPPNGRGCDVKAHTEFLTLEGADAEFAYANILKDGNAYILGQQDFEAECEFWKNFGPRGPYSSVYA